jgi:hypothetical protein
MPTTLLIPWGRVLLLGLSATGLYRRWRLLPDALKRPPWHNVRTSSNIWINIFSCFRPSVRVLWAGQALSESSFATNCTDILSCFRSLWRCAVSGLYRLPPLPSYRRVPPSCSGTCRTLRHSTTQTCSGISPPHRAPSFGSLARNTAGDSRRAPYSCDYTDDPASPEPPSWNRENFIHIYRKGLSEDGFWQWWWSR